MLTFFDDLFDKAHRSRIPQSPQKRKTEYHGVATAVGKISKRLHSIEQALQSTVKEDTPTPTKEIKTPAPEPIVAEIPTVPITVTAPNADTVTKPEEGPIVKTS